MDEPVAGVFVPSPRGLIVVPYVSSSQPMSFKPHPKGRCAYEQRQACHQAVGLHQLQALDGWAITHL